MNLNLMLFVVLLVFGSAIAQQHSAVGDTPIVNESTLKGADIQPEEQIRKLFWVGKENFFWSTGIGSVAPKKMRTFILPTFNVGYQHSLASVPRPQNIRFEEKDSSINSSEVLFQDSLHKKWAFFFSYGLTDFGMGLNYRFGYAYAIGIRGGVYYMSGSGASSLGFNSGRGIGVRISRSFHYKVINTVNCEYVFLFDIVNYTQRYPLLKGGALEVNVGYENKYTGGFLWAIGAVVNSGKSAPSLVLPIVKLGFIFNL